MSAKIFEFVATIQCSAVIAAPDETTARQCVETWEHAWFETGEIVGVVDVDLTDVRPAPRTKEVQEDVAHIVLTKRAGQSEKPCALEAERDALRERCERLARILKHSQDVFDAIDMTGLCPLCQGDEDHNSGCPMRAVEEEVQAALATEVKP